MIEKIKKTSEFLTSKMPFEPITGVILGTGLGDLVSQIEIEWEIPYQEIPNFPVSTVESHSGRLIFGRIAEKPVVTMQGRFHYYEGYSMEEVIFPVRVMKQLGIETLMISNASGGLNPEYAISDLMIINDHINLLPESPLRGKHYDEFGPRFPDMSEAYDKNLIARALKIGEAHDIKLQQGIYAAVSGPVLETPAEYDYLRRIGADAVGMSTIPENIAARQMGLPVFAISVITDLGVPGKIKEVKIEHVIEAAKVAEPNMTRIFKELIASL